MTGHTQLACGTGYDDGEGLTYIAAYAAVGTFAAERDSCVGKPEHLGSHPAAYRPSGQGLLVLLDQIQPWGLQTGEAYHHLVRPAGPHCEAFRDP